MQIRTLKQVKIRLLRRFTCFDSYRRNFKEKIIEKMARLTAWQNHDLTYTEVVKIKTNKRATKVKK